MIYNYIYRIDDPVTKEFYFGSRSCDIEPSQDKYMGSMKTWKPEDKSRLVKTIIRSDFKSREQAFEYEDMLIALWIEDTLNRNYHRPKKGFSTYGTHCTENHRLKISNRLKGNRNFLGHKHSEETKKKISEKAKNISSEVRSKLSKSMKGNKNGSKSILFNDIIFNSRKDLAKYLNISKPTLYRKYLI